MAVTKNNQGDLEDVHLVTQSDQPDMKAEEPIDYTSRNA